MELFHINLIRDRVMPPARRRRLFLGMLVYVLVTGIVLAYVVFRSTGDLLAVTYRQRKAEHLIRAFCEDHPAFASVVPCTARLAARMTRCRERLDFVQSVLERRWDLAPVLVGLVRALPEGVHLTSFEAGAAPVMSFELAVPATRSAEGVDSKVFIAAWNGDDDLMKRIADIAAVSSHQQGINEHSVYVVKFSCRRVSGG